MASLTALPATAQEVLDLFSDQLTAQGVTLPDRRYRCPGAQPVWDGEQFTVALMGISQGQPGHGDMSSMVPQALVLFAMFSVNLLRAVSVINTDDGPVEDMTPTPEQMDQDGQTVIADAAALILAAAEIKQAYSLTGVGEGFVIDGLQPLGPEAGLAGNRLLISVSLS